MSMDWMIPERPFDAASWHLALTLVERAEALRRTEGEGREVAVDTEAGQRRLASWRAQKPFGDESLFQHRLGVDDLTESLFETILGMAIERTVPRSASRAPWLDTLERALSLPRSRDALLVPEKFAAVPTTGFLEIARPLIDDGRRRLRDSAAALACGVSTPMFDPDTADRILAPCMAEPMLRMVMRTMVLEMNVAKVQGLLSGDTSAERFADFVRRLRQPEVAIGIFLEYPVLARQLVRRVGQWVEAGQELLAHLVADGPLLQSVFGADSELGSLTGFEGNSGDSHRDGRAVGIASFRSGTKLVYKPRPLAAERHFQDLLAWLNAHGADPPFRILKVLDRGDHGWMEFVAPGPCASIDEVDRFYARQGANLALLYALGATDIHFENLIAAGEHPVLVDLETLFHPLLVDEFPPSLVTKESLFRTGLLPVRLNAGGDYAGMDISGLGNPEGQLTSHKAPAWDDSFQDSMRFVRRRVPMRGAANRPTLRGEPVEITQGLAALRTGFDAMYGLLSRHRDALLAAGGPIEQFASDEMRMVIRNTRAYLSLLGEAFHPDALRDALEQDRLFDHLWASTAKVPLLLKLVEAERASLARCDVPLFAIRPSNMDVLSDCGVRIPDVIAISGYDRTAWRLRGLDTANRVRQAWCIDAAFACIGDGRHQTTGFAPGKGGRSAALGAVLLEDRPLRDRLLAAACCVGERLSTLAFVDGETAGWHVLRQIDERYWSIESAGMDLYSGLPGIALFLAYLGRLTGDDRHAALTRSCVSTMRRVIALTRNVEKQIGGFEGWGGVLYVFCCLASALDDRSLIADAESIVDLLPALIVQDERLDMISGAAGCIGGLLCLHRAAPSPSTLAAAIACGERLLSRGQAMEQGMAWRTAIAPEHPLCGLSHGASGIGLALLELSTATDDPRFRAAAEQAFRYERSQRLREGGWRDLRQPRPDAGAAQPAVAPHATTAWCHGASGIGLARVRALAHGEDRDIREDLTAALADTMRDGFGHNHSLCHGDLGNLELLLQARMDPVEAWVRDALDRRLVEILESIARDGFHCATPGSVDTPGLMLGLAGIGYQLLRLADPASVPAVLLLEAPKLHERSEDR